MQLPGGAGSSTDGKEQEDAVNGQAAVPQDIFDFYEKLDKEEEEDTELKTVAVEINQDKLEILQKR